MKKPIAVKIDRENKVGYIYYTDDAKSAETVDAWEDGSGVMADLNAAGEIVGIELLSLNDETLRRAADFAREHGLAFPEITA